jgi:hypothetical protein
MNLNFAGHIRADSLNRGKPPSSAVTGARAPVREEISVP